MKISKKLDFLEEKTYTEQNETNLFNDEKIEIEDKNKMANCLDGNLKFKEVVSKFLSRRKRKV